MNPAFYNASKNIMQATCRLAWEAYSESLQTPKMEVFIKIVNSWKLSIIFKKGYVLDVWQDSQHTSVQNISWAISKWYEKILSLAFILCKVLGMKELNFFRVTRKEAVLINCEKTQDNHRSKKQIFISRFP